MQCHICLKESLCVFRERDLWKNFIACNFRLNHFLLLPFIPSLLFSAHQHCKAFLGIEWHVVGRILRRKHKNSMEFHETCSVSVTPSKISSLKGNLFGADSLEKLWNSLHCRVYSHRRAAILSSQLLRQREKGNTHHERKTSIIPIKHL